MLIYLIQSAPLRKIKLEFEDCNLQLRLLFYSSIQTSSETLKIITHIKTTNNRKHKSKYIEREQQ